MLSNYKLNLWVQRIWKFGNDRYIIDCNIHVVVSNAGSGIGWAGAGSDEVAEAGEWPAVEL